MSEEDIAQLKSWAENAKLSTETRKILIKEGWTSLDAVILMDAGDLENTKIPRGPQKLLLHAVKKLQKTVLGDKPEDQPKGADGKQEDGSKGKEDMDPHMAAIQANSTYGHFKYSYPIKFPPTQICLSSSN